MRWEKDPDRLTDLFAATARPPLRQRLTRFLPLLIVAVVCVLLICSPILTLLW